LLFHRKQEPEADAERMKGAPSVFYYAPLKRLLIVIASVFSVQTTVKKINENKKVPALKVSGMEVRKLR
jgi:hypothetical protein